MLSLSKTNDYYYNLNKRKTVFDNHDPGWHQFIRMILNNFDVKEISYANCYQSHDGAVLRGCNLDTNCYNFCHTL